MKGKAGRPYLLAVAVVILAHQAGPSGRQSPVTAQEQSSQSSTGAATGRDQLSIASVSAPSEGLQRALRFPREWYTATVLADGRVLVLGGRDGAGRPVEAAELIDPATGTSKVAGIHGWNPAFGHSATLLNDHEILVAGGVTMRGEVADLQILDINDLQVRTIGTLPGPRAFHAAMLLADGRVALWAGRNSIESLETSGVVIDSATGSQSEIFAPESDPSTLYVAAADPSDGSNSVPIDHRLTIRFSKPVRIERASEPQVTLVGPEGDIPTHVVFAEAGRLLFATPERALEPDTQYVATVASVADAHGSMLAAVNLTFHTAASQKETGPRHADDEGWDPFERGQLQEWRTNRRESPWQRLAPLKAPAGVTALAGQALRLNGTPLAGVTMELDGLTTTTDESGRFLLSFGAVSSGWKELWIDGRTANRGQSTYGTFEVGVHVTAGETNVLPFVVWMPKIDTAHKVTVTSPTTAEVVITTPSIPGLELHLPPGTVIRDHEGQVVHDVSITPIPLDRPPFPLPVGVDVPIYFTIQPGGAYVHVEGSGTAGYARGARLIYPNYKARPANSPMDFWHYDPEDGKGWYVYGHGKVAGDGRQVIPDQGVSIHEFTGAMVAPPWLAALLGPLFGNPWDGDPVDLGTGLFVLEKTDLALADVLPLTLHRTYRQNDTVSRSFGIGATHLYDMFLVGNTFPYTYIELILPSGTRVHFDRISPGTGYADAVYEHASTPSVFFKSRVSWNGNGWDLLMKDGTRVTFREGFGASRPAQSAATRIQDRYGNAAVLTRNTDADLTRITSPNGRWIELTYDTSHRVTQARDNINRLVQYTYDSSGRLWKVTDAAGGVTEYTYDSNHRMVTLKDPRSIVYLTNEYDTAGRLIKQTQADSTTYLFAYTLDGSGNVVQTDVTNPRGYVRRVTFNSVGYVTSDTRAVGQPEQQTITYERQSGTNLVSAVIDPLNRRTSLTYDGFANLTTRTRLAGTSDAVTTAFTYDSTFNQLTSVTDPLNHTTTIGYDSQGRLQSTTDPLNHQATFTTNSAGQVLTATNALSKTTTFGYDLGVLFSVQTPLGHMQTRFVDAAGRVVAVTDAAGSVARFQYDSYDQLTKIIDPTGRETGFTYDGNGNVLTLTDARGTTTTWTYDNMDRIATRTDPLTRQESFGYDLNGNLRSWTDRKGQVTTYQFDALDRQAFVGFGTTGTPATYTSTIATTYDAGDRATAIVDSVSGTITRTFDLLDRLTEEQTPEGTVCYTYDAAGRRSSMTVAGQTAVSYDYDTSNRLTGITQGTASVAIAYDDANRRTSLTLPNGIVMEYRHDDDSQLTEITYKQGMSTLGALTYGYDTGGRRTSVSGSYARTGLPPGLTSATYDDANQITTWGGTSFTYDSNGNLTSDGVRSYTWDERNQLASLTGPVSASFGYDGFGRRRAKTMGSTTTQFLHDGPNPVQELSGSSPTANLLTGLAIDEYFTRTDAAGVRNYLTEALGGVIALADGAAAVQTEYTYEPFGATTTSGATTTNAFGFTGREADASGLHYYRARYYDSRLQRFITEDPVGLAGGDVNLYEYVANDPQNLVDPLGLFVFIPHGSSLPTSGRKDSDGAPGNGAFAPAPMGAAFGDTTAGNPAAAALGIGITAAYYGYQYAPAIGKSLTGFVSWAKKADIAFIDYLQRKYRMTDAERELFHEEITKQGYSRQELEELAKQYGSKKKK
jgi:RHS repeat-associated protein